jgi:hypothetical protein
MNYHLKVLGDLLQKNEEGRYLLSEKGRLASRLLLEFPDGVKSAAMPTGVSLVSALAMFSSFVFGFFAFAIEAFSGSFLMFRSNSVNPLFLQLMVLLLAILSVASFGASFAVLRGSSSKYLWFSMLAVWSGLLAYSFVFHVQFWTAFGASSSNVYSEAAVVLVLVAPFIYSVCCIAYFLTQKPRRYFHLKET